MTSEAADIARDLEDLVEPDVATVRDFIEIISDHAATAFAEAKIEKPGVLQISRLHPDSENLVPSRFKIGDVGHMVACALEDSAAGHNVYVEGRTVGDSVTGNRRGTEEETVGVFAVVIDSDADKGMGWQPPEGAEPSVTVRTSPGNHHFWYLLKKAISAADGKKLGERIRAAAGADHDTGTMTQPYRVAGTMNYPSKKKRERGRTETHMTSLLSGTPRAWAVEELERVFPAAVEKKTNGGGNGQGTFDEGSIPRAVMDAIQKGEEKGKRSHSFYWVIARLKKLGWTIAGIVSLLEKYPRGIAQKYEKRLEKEVARIFKKVETDNARRLTAAADFYAYLPQHNYIYAPTGELWPASSVDAQHGKGTAGLLDETRAVVQMIWAPGLPTLISGRVVDQGGWIEKQGVTIFNLYRPPTTPLGDPTKAAPWLEHVRNVYPNDADHIIRYLAHRVQRPHEKINHGLVLGGAPGTGKDTLLEPVKRAVGPWNVHEVSPQSMLRRFNNFAKSIILRISEVRDLGDLDRFAFYEHMKIYLAAPPDVIRCDEKNIREHAVFNVMGVIMTSNRKDSFFLPADDRRHYVAWTDATAGDFAGDYWKTIWDWYEAGGGYSHVAAYLTTLDLSTFNPKAPPPKTAVFWEIVETNRSSENSELADALDKLDNPSAVTLAMIKQSADYAFSEWLRDRRNSRQVPHRMSECGYVPVRNSSAKDGTWVVGGKRQMIYAKAELSIHDRYDAATALARNPPKLENSE